MSAKQIRLESFTDEPEPPEYTGITVSRMANALVDEEPPMFYPETEGEAYREAIYQSVFYAICRTLDDAPEVPTDENLDTSLRAKYADEDETIQTSLTDTDRDDDATLTDRCIALTSDGDRCANARSYMTETPLCAPHDRADSVETIGDRGTLHSVRLLVALALMLVAPAALGVLLVV